MTDDQTKALDEIRAERRRQVEAEGWTPEHDDTHTDGELLAAAIIYLHHGTEKAAPLCGDGVPVSWPWDAAWWKPKDRRRNLVRAGALALADNERRERAGLDAGPAVRKLNLAVRELAARDHAAEAVETEREENAKIADRVSIKSSAMRSLDAKGRCDAADEIATDIRARSKGATDANG